VRRRTGTRTARVAAVRRHEDAVSRLNAARQATGSFEDINRLLSDGLTSLAEDVGVTVTAEALADPSLSMITGLGRTTSGIVEALTVLRERQQKLASFPEDADRLASAAEEAASAAERAAADSAERAPAL